MANSLVEMRNDAIKLSIVVPVFNEEMTLATIIEKLLTVEHLHEIVIIDNASVDSSPIIIKRLADEHAVIKTFRLPVNRGKSPAVKAGFAVTTGSIVIVQDADLEYDPAEIPDLIYPIVSKNADVVYGSRFMVKRAARVLYFYHYVGNKFLTFLSNMLTNLNLTDVSTCYKAFRGDIIRNMTIVTGGFGFDFEVTAKMAKLKCVLYEVPISYYGRTYEEGKKITYRDGISAFYNIIRFNLFCSLRSSYVKLPDAKQATPPLIDSRWNENR